MALTINDILARNLFPGLEFAAGSDHGTNAVTWVNIMEILDSTESVKPGELLITTGYGLEERSVYGTVVEQLKDRGVSGIIIQPGYYIDRIPQFIRDDANRLGLPVLSIPAHYSFSDLLRVLISEIVSESGSLPVTGFDSARALKSLNEKLDASKEFMISRKMSARLVCITPVNMNTPNLPQVAEAVRHLTRAVTSRISTCLTDLYPGGHACFLLLSEDSRPLSTVLYDLQASVTTLSETSGIHLYAGTDRAVSREELPQAMQHALQCIGLLRQIDARRGICSYEDYAFINNFGLMFRSARGQMAQNQSLQILLSRDRTRQTGYIDTLRVYLSENCNTSRAAARLFIHRHTLLNRLETIRDLSGLDLQSYYSRIWLAQALLMHDLYGM